MQLWRTRWRRAGIIAAAVGGLSSCLLTSSFDGLTGGPDLPDAGADAPPDSAAGGASASSSSSSSGTGGAGGGAAPCPGKVGPTPVAIPALGFCIDSTEVTNAQYELFLASMPDLGSLPAACSWKMTFVPSIVGSNDVPVTGVDWCDAYAFCAWNGKRLCTKLGGGQLTMAEAADANKSEWMAACSAHGTRTYPYAPINYDPMACNGVDVGSSAPKNAGSFQACEGGYPGIFDLSGNVGEWEDGCEETDPNPALHTCWGRGGDYGDMSPNLVCTRVEQHSRDARLDYIGFRCCGG